MAHQLQASDEEDRRSRFQSSSVTENGTASLRERAASQPPRNSEQSFLPSPPSQQFIPSSLGGIGNPWSGSRLVSSNRASGQPVPIRSSSLSSQPQTQFGSMMRERAFPSTLEDDESEGFSDTYDELYVPPSLSRGRSYGQDISRSRSQSLANTRPGPVGSPYTGSSALQSWNESYLSTAHPLNIPSGRGYSELQPSGASRYGSLGTLARSPSNNFPPSPTAPSLVGNGFSRHQPDISNMSPFRRDVGQILLDDGPFRELWAGMNPPRDESGGTGSGTTSRRHSVSVVQPRRGNIVGFNAPGSDSPEETTRPTFGSGFGRGGLMLSDDDLASDLGNLNLQSDVTPPSSSSHHPPSQPASLPIYAPLSRSPPSKELFQPIINVSSTTYTASRQTIGTPSDGGQSASGTGGSPTRTSGFIDQTDTSQYFTSTEPARPRQTQGQTGLTARYIPGQGIHFLPSQQGRHAGAASSGTHGANAAPGAQTTGAEPGAGAHYTRARAPSYSSQANLTSPISPTGTRLINPQQQPYYPQQMQRRSSNAQQLHDNAQPQTPLNELGKGVPLHSIPPSCPLFIVEFKAGRTDLFYVSDLAQDVRVGDLVIVEADRGKDLGKVINDTITLGEVEAFQKQQAERIAGGSGYGADGQPTSPGGTAAPGSGTKKEINPKMIYGKAGPQDTQILATKLQDEQKALQLCQSKVRAKKLPMEVIDAEYQWDRRKLTFYFIAEKRIDFRELVRELFRLYKTRIWMASLQGPGGFEQ